MSESEKPRTARLTPKQARAALLVLDDYVDDSSMEMREALIVVCEELRGIAEASGDEGRTRSSREY